MNPKKKKLIGDLKRYREKLAQMIKNWSATRGGSRYGDEYLEMQIKVYQQMVMDTMREIQEL